MLLRDLGPEATPQVVVLRDQECGPVIPHVREAVEIEVDLVFLPLFEAESHVLAQQVEEHFTAAVSRRTQVILDPRLPPIVPILDEAIDDRPDQLRLARGQRPNRAEAGPAVEGFSGEFLPGFEPVTSAPLSDGEKARKVGSADAPPFDSSALGSGDGDGGEGPGRSGRFRGPRGSARIGLLPKLAILPAP